MHTNASIFKTDASENEDFWRTESGPKGRLGLGPGLEARSLARLELSKQIRFSFA